MKHITRLIAIFFYILIMSFFLDFQLGQLFDLKQLVLVIFGTGILFLPGYKRGESRGNYIYQVGECALFASYIQTFILLFMTLSTVTEMTKNALFQEIARNCRPILYGICLSAIFSGGGAKERKKLPPQDDNPPKTLTATQIYESYRALGLTNREAELAVQIERGLSNGEIAAQLCISETTVKKHISNIFEKLDVNKREQIKEKRNIKKKQN